MDIIDPRTQYIKIIAAYCIFRIISFNLSLFKITIGNRNGSIIILNGKHVIVTPPYNSS